MNAIDFVEVEDRADVWMIEGGSKARFSLETLEVRFARGKLGRQDFDYERATQLRIDGLVDRALSALTELLENLVISQRRTDHRVGATDYTDLYK